MDLGLMPLANAYIEKENLNTDESRYPLAIMFCPQCSLIQLSHVVDPRILYKDYAYMTSASQPLIGHFGKLAEEIKQKYITSTEDLLIEIASNDGTLLKNFIGNCRLLGIEPAETVAEYTKKAGIETITQFFNLELAIEILEKYGFAKVVVANNVLAHIDNIDEALASIAMLLHEDGVFMFEVHWVGNLIGDGGFDQIYHEHLSYFSLHALYKAAADWGLVVRDAVLVPTHGQSLRVTFARQGNMSKQAEELLSSERYDRKLLLSETYQSFSKKVFETRGELKRVLMDIKSAGKRIAAYGASAKGNTLLNFCELGPELLDYVSDTTPLKQGRYTPGAHIPIVSPEELRKNTPDFILLLAWNYADVIIKKEEWFLERGGKFIIPVPKVRIIEKSPT